jgi:AcrR family transcriptional regulator
VGTAPAASSRPRRRRLKPEQRRELILRAAAEEFGRRGHSEARLEDIARAAGTTKAVIYDHFADKRALHAEVIKRAERDALVTVAEAVGPPRDDPEERYRDGLLASFRLIADRPDVRMMLLGSPGAPREVSRAQVKAMRRSREATAVLYLSDPAFLPGHPRREERAEAIAQAATPEALTDIAMSLLWHGLDSMRDA